MGTNSPQFPLYIPTKSRSEYMITSRVLTELGLRHFLVVEPQQVDDYAKAVRRFSLLATILPLDLSFKERYELCDTAGLSKSTGSGPARNFAWEHAKAAGHAWHWVMDDNILSFRRLNKNEKVKVSNGAVFRAMEDFALRYRNVAMAGPNYYMFAPARRKIRPFTLNTRIYSCNLIRNDLPYRWRGRYNEDTILSLDMLKGGWCTILFNAFLQQKMATQTLPGGNTSELYQAEDRPKAGQKYSATGTIAKSQMLVDQHPDVAKVVWKFNRWHHEVDYARFKRLALVKRPDIEIAAGVDNYGMQLQPRRKLG